MTQRRASARVFFLSAGGPCGEARGYRGKRRLKVIIFSYYHQRFRKKTSTTGAFFSPCRHSCVTGRGLARRRQGASLAARRGNVDGPCRAESGNAFWRLRFRLSLSAAIGFSGGMTSPPLLFPPFPPLLPLSFLRSPLPFIHSSSPFLLPPPPLPLPLDAPRRRLFPNTLAIRSN